MTARDLFAPVRLLAAAAALCAGASTARADLQLNLVSTQSELSQGLFVYDVAFLNGGGGTSSTAQQRLEAGNAVTLFDIQGYVAGSATPGASILGLFNLTVQNSGLNPTGFGAVDNPALPNVTLTYAGTTPQFTDMQYARAFTVQSIFTTVALGDYSSRVTKNTGSAAGTAVNTAGEVGVPALPEPSGVVAALAGIPCLGGLLGFARRLRRPVAAA